MHTTTENQQTQKNILWCSRCSIDFANAEFTLLKNHSGLSALELLEGGGSTETHPIPLILKPCDSCPICLKGKIQDTKREEVYIAE